MTRSYERRAGVGPGSVRSRSGVGPDSTPSRPRPHSVPTPSPLRPHSVPTPAPATAMTRGAAERLRRVRAARAALPAADADILRDALIAEGARTVIEVGLAYGSSALAIGEALCASGRADV